MTRGRSDRPVVPAGRVQRPCSAADAPLDPAGHPPQHRRTSPREIRRIFTTEGVVLALLGWLVGIPLGYPLTRLIVRLVWEIVDVRLPVVFPPGNVLVALVGTTVLTLLVMVLPVRRAVRFRPGDALHYD